LRGGSIKGKNHHLVPGFHAVLEALVHGKSQIKEVWIAEGRKPVRIREILQLATRESIPILIKKDAELSHLLPDMSHQGVVAVVKKFNYVDLESLTEIHLQKQALFVALDHITDEGNLGSIIRTAVFFGAHGLIIPKDRSAGVSARVLKRSSGAFVHVPISRVVNMARALDLLKKRGFWIVGTSGESPSTVYDFDWNRDVVMVLGNEQKGLSQAVRRQCHHVVSIPASGHAESLNVAVASGVILAEIVRQRKSK